MIIRIFRAVILPDRHQTYENFLLNTAIPLVRSQKGVLETSIGRPTAQAPNEYVFVSTWQDLDALKQFAGEEWDKAVIQPELVPLLQECFIHHYEQF